MGLDSPFKFHFVKNGMEDIVRRMPIHAMVQWASSPNEVIMFIEDPCKKQKVGLMFPLNKLNDALSPTNIDKGFKVKDFPNLDVMVVLLKWIEFKELIESEWEEITRDL